MAAQLCALFGLTNHGFMPAIISTALLVTTIAAVASCPHSLAAFVAAPSLRPLWPHIFSCGLHAHSLWWPLCPHYYCSFLLHKFGCGFFLAVLGGFCGRIVAFVATQVRLWLHARSLQRPYWPYQLRPQKSDWGLFPQSSEAFLANPFSAPSSNLIGRSILARLNGHTSLTVASCPQSLQIFPSFFGGFLPHTPHHGHICLFVWGALSPISSLTIDCPFIKSGDSGYIYPFFCSQD